MGRGGGGGGSHHSSHSSSSHSHSGGSRSYSSSRSSSYSSSSHHSGGSHYYGGGSGGSGCSAVGSVFFILFFGFMFLVMFASMKGQNIFDYFKMTRSSVQREMLDGSKCDPIDEWYQDDWGDWIDEPGEEGELIAGLQYFYNKTGVQPYLWITGEEGGDYKSEGSLEELSEAKYKELFGEDEGHVIIIFREYPNESSNYICTVTPGYDAETVVMDEEAREILLDHIDYYYTSTDLNEGEFFAKAFTKSADKIMVKQLSWKQIGVIIAVAIILVVGLIITFSIIKKRKVAVAQQKAKQAQAEKDKKQIEFNQQKYQDAIEKEYVSVECPNCGASGNKIRKGTVAYCQFCGTAISVDMIGQAFIGDIFSQQQAQTQQQTYQQPQYQPAPQGYQQPVQTYPQVPQQYQVPQGYQAPQAYPQAPAYQQPQAQPTYQQPPQNYQQPPQ